MNVVIGLGNLGLPIARNLSSRTPDVIGVDIDGSRRDAWQAATGFDAVASVDDVDWTPGARAFVVVRLASEAGEVLDRLHGRAVGHELSAFVITTLDPSFARGFARYDGGPLRVVELPVSGGQAGALAGSLTMMAAGPLTEDDRSFLLSSVGSHLVEFTERGHPAITKLLNNVTAAYNARTLAEMLIVAHDEGIDVRRFYDVLSTASGGSWIAAGFRDLVDDLLDKDVGLLRDHLGSLPVISLGAGDGLVERLGAARRLLQADEQGGA